jgi:hypothetical protein
MISELCVADAINAISSLRPVARTPCPYLDFLPDPCSTDTQLREFAPLLYPIHAKLVPLQLQPGLRYLTVILNPAASTIPLGPNLTFPAHPLPSPTGISTVTSSLTWYDLASS